MKGAAIILICAFALASGESEEEIELNALGCPVDPEVFLTIPDSTYCNVFYNCLNGRPIPQICPDNLVFNNTVGICDWPFNVDCTGKGIKIPESTETEEESEKPNPGGNGDPSQAPAICAREDSDGILVAHEHCNKFYNCDKGLPVEVECPTSLLYNHELGICDWFYQVECGDRIVPTIAQIKRAAYKK